MKFGFNLDSKSNLSNELGESGIKNTRQSINHRHTHSDFRTSGFKDALGYLLPLFGFISYGIIANISRPSVLKTSGNNRESGTRERERFNPSRSRLQGKLLNLIKHKG
jgi:hypothetical protein